MTFAEWEMASGVTDPTKYVLDPFENTLVVTDSPEMPVVTLDPKSFDRFKPPVRTTPTLTEADIAPYRPTTPVSTNTPESISDYGVSPSVLGTSIGTVNGGLIIQSEAAPIINQYIQIPISDTVVATEEGIRLLAEKVSAMIGQNLSVQRSVVRG